MYHVKITNIAEEGIFSTVKCISFDLKANKAANNLLDEIEKNVILLRKNPYIFPLVSDEDLEEKGIRFVLIKNYMMFYFIEEDKKNVNIIRFLYGRRDWKNILKAEKQLAALTR